MTDWADILADQILANMQAWVAEAGQLAQNEQSSDAFDAHMHDCLVDKIRWMVSCGNTGGVPAQGDREPAPDNPSTVKTDA